MNINNSNITKTSYNKVPVLDGENGQAKVGDLNSIAPEFNMPANIYDYVPGAYNLPVVYNYQTSPIYSPAPNSIDNSYNTTQAFLPSYSNYSINPNLPVEYTPLGVQKTPYGENIYLYQLKNGQKVAIMPKEGTTIVKTFVNSGSMNETDPIRGISHFIEHNLFNGSKNLKPGQFFNEVAKMGASTNASTDYAQTDYYIESSLMSKEGLVKTIQMHADMLVNPLFPKDMIEKERGPVTSEISMVNDDISTKAANEVVRNLFQIQSKSDNLVAGSLETVNNLKQNDLIDYWQKHYTPDNMYTVIVGDVNPDEAMNLISKNFNQPAALESSKNKITETLTPIQKPVRVDFKSPIDNCCTILAGFAGPKPGDFKESIATIALGRLLVGGINSRLTRNLAQLNSYADYDMQKIGLKPTDPQALFYQMLTPKNMEQEALDMFYATVNQVAQYPPTQNEMDAIKKNLNKMVAAIFEDPVSICETIGTGFLDNNLKSIADYKNVINSLTPADIQRAAINYMDLSKVSIAVVHPADVSDETIIKNFSKSAYALNKTANKTINTTQNTAHPPGLKFGSRHISMSGIEEAVLPDNTHIALNNSDSEICYINWRLTSKESVPKNLATPYVLKEILNNGSTKTSKADFISKAESKGIDFFADSNGFEIELDASSMKDDTAEAISMMKEALFNPRFSKQDFEIAKQKIASYCESLSKDAGNNLLVHLYGDYFATPKQIVDGLNSLTLDDVKKHYADMINNASSTFVVSAPFDKDMTLKNKVLASVNNNGMKFKNHVPKLTQVYTPNEYSKVLVDTEERNQAEIYETFSFKMSGNIEDEVKFELLNTILGGSPSSRLFQDLREKQKLAYRVSSQVQAFEDTGILTFSIMTTTDDKKQNDIKYDNIQKSIDGFKYHAQRLMDEPVTEEELNNAKLMLKQAIARQTELPDSKTSLIAMNMTQPYGIKRIDEYCKAIDKMTINDIQEAARHVFGNKPVYSILASKDTINNQKEYLQTLGEVNYLNTNGDGQVNLAA